MILQKRHKCVQARAVFWGTKRCAPSRLSLILLLYPAGCSQAPSQNILGSFFPAWMLCSAVGVAAAVAVRTILGIIKLDTQLLAPPLAYLAVAVAVTLFVWLYQFGQ